MLPGHGRDTRTHPEPATEIVMPPARSVSLDPPDGIPPWLAAFVLDAQRETDTLRDNGAEQAAAARVALLRKLIAAAQVYFDTELDAAAAASETGRCEETIPPAVRDGTIPHRRADARSPPPVRRADLQ